ncbi:efflux RND transporter periplasmic adaptor subunit [Gammaproteobacteria bacterium]|nr:efflux RND transporter periplasmic adaptor subunit [Gammaproteobacteria bacterium]
MPKSTILFPKAFTYLKKSLWSRELIELALLSTLALALSGCGEQTQKDAVETIARPVKILEVSRARDSDTRRYPAVIGAANRAELSFLVGGVIVELPVNEAEAVQAGELIAKLDPRDFESALSSVRASFTNAQEEYRRAERLDKQDAIAKSVVAQRRAQYDMARAQLESAEKALLDSVLVAPFDGVVASLPVREQQTVSPGSLIATVIDIRTLEATINLPASVVARFPEQAKHPQARISVLLDAAPSEPIEASFSEAQLVADISSQTYAATFRFSAPPSVLVLPGMNATVVVEQMGESTDEAIGVPLSAVQNDAQGHYVWRAVGASDETLIAQRQAIEIDSAIGEQLTVRSGLAIGDRIVGAGAAYLSQGERIVPWTDAD